MQTLWFPGSQELIEMVAIFSIWVLALAVSLDSFVVGAAYGLRKIQLARSGILIIAGLSAVALASAMGLGQWMSAWVSLSTGQMIGALLLIFVGAWALWQQRQQLPHKSVSRQGHSEHQLPNPPVHREKDGTLFSLELRQIGLVVQVLRKPMLADRDKSGTISAGESILLGIALAMDAFAAGLGAAFLGFDILQTALAVGLVCAVGLTLGLKLGQRCATLRWMRAFTWLPGCLLIGLGIARLLSM